MINIQTLLNIIFAVFGFALFIGFIIIAYFWGQSSIRDNPNKAKILVKAGHRLAASYKGQLTEKNDVGCTYKYNGNEKVMIPHVYGEDYDNKGKRLIFISGVGQIIASPFDKNVKLNDTEKANLIYSLIESNIGGQIVRAMQGTKTMNVIIWAVVAFVVGIVLMFGFNYWQNSQAKATVNQPTTSQSNQKLPEPVEVK